MKPSLAPFSGGFRRASNARRRALVFLVALAGASQVLRAHGDLDVQIQSLSEQIAAAPSAALHLKRGILHHQHEDYVRALDDFDHAERLAPTLAIVGLARSRTLLQSGRFAAARTTLNAFLERAPGHAEALLLRARTLAGLGDNATAVLDFNRHLELVLDPLPESYLERSTVLVAAGDLRGALAGLDEGIHRIGNLVTLQDAAITLELQLGRPDAALARVDRIMSGLDRRETWLARRGNILDAAGRRDQALRAYSSALSAVEQLPAHHRETKPMRDLQELLRTKLGW